MKHSRAFARLIAIIIMLSMVMPTYSVFGVYDPIDEDFGKDNVYGEQWGPAQIEVDYAWDLTGEGTLTNPGSDEIVIAVIDTGIFHSFDEEEDEDIWHADLLPGETLWINEAELNGVDDFDDDGNGYDDDIYGYNFNEDNGFPWDTGVHGTNVAGIIAAQIDNLEEGMAGMAQIKLMILRATAGQNPQQPIQNAVQYAIDNGADIISGSFNDQNDDATYLDQLAADARNAGILWVNSVGNTATKIMYPATISDVFAVGATVHEEFHDDDRYWASAYSGSGEDLDVVAPGGWDIPKEKIWTATTADTQGSYYGTAYMTSMATPHASGLAGLIKSYRPTFNPDRISQLLKATATDITDEDTNDPKYDEDCSVGKDTKTGWGEVNAAYSLGYANFLRDRWSDGTSVQAGSTVSAYDKQASIAVDSYGRSHIVWLEKSNAKDTVFYTTVDSAGRLGTTMHNIEQKIHGQDPVTTNTDSAYPDVYVDKDDNVHISWMKYTGGYFGTPEIYYRPLDSGLVRGVMVQVTFSGTVKEYPNIVAYENNDPAIVYCSKNGMTNNWDIYWTKKTNRVWAAPAAIVTEAGAPMDQNRLTADILNTGGKEIISMAYEEKPTGQQNGREIELCQWDFSTQQKTITPLTNNDGKENLDPNLCTVHQEDLVYVVWTTMDFSGGADIVEMSGLKTTGLNAESIIYGETEITDGGRQVGNAAGDAGFWDKRFPKVSAGVVGEVDRLPGKETRIIQVDVIWQEIFNGVWNVFNTELTQDGRCLLDGEQQLLFEDCQGIPQIIASQHRSSTRTDWLESDCNFRLLYYYSYGGLQNQLWFASTSERWTPNVKKQDGAHQPYMLDMDIDSANGLHIVYSNGVKEIVYTYWGANRPDAGGNPTHTAVISPAGIDCGEPKITTYVDSEGDVYAHIIYLYNYWETNQELWYTQITKIDGVFDQEANSKLGCTSATYDYPPSDHEIAHDYLNQEIGVVWSEHEAALEKNDIHFGIIDYSNTGQLIEIRTSVKNTNELDVDPDVDVDTDGNYHIVWESDGDILYNVADSTDSYTKMHDNNIQIDDKDTTLQSYYPAIRVDRELDTRSDIHRDKEFIHIGYSRKHASEDLYTIWYSKVTDTGTIVIPEKLVSTVSDWSEDYASEDPIAVQLILDKENRISIVYMADMIYPNPIFSHNGVFHLKLDNNGEVIKHEAWIGAGLDPCADYCDEYGFLNIVWRAWDNGPEVWKYGFSMERYLVG